MNKYEEKKAARIERLKGRSANAKKKSESILNDARDMASVIPFGQPILVGHHSEGRDRNYRKRIGAKYDKGFKEMEKAEYYAEKAASAENNTAISSDDPEAVTKLKEKIAKAETTQEKMKTINKFLKAKGGPKRQELYNLGLTDSNIDNLLKPDFAGRIGYPDYALTNNNANIRRMKQRLEQLERARQDEETETEINGVRIVENVEENRCQLFFPGKPSEAIRKELKGHGFRWSPLNGCWQRQRSNGATYDAKRIVEMQGGE